MLDERMKYPKTPHVPWSQGTSDDKTLLDDNQFHNKDVIVTLKMDGENTSIYNDYIHARSLYPPTHPSQSWVKKLAGEVGYKLLDSERICGENLYARHTIPYNDLESYFMVFSIWTKDLCWEWEDTLSFTKELGLITVPVIYEGKYDKEAILKAYEPYRSTHEGYVIRTNGPFYYEDFACNVAKYVNPEFRQALKENNVHWATAPVVPNQLKK